MSSSLNFGMYVKLKFNHWINSRFMIHMTVTQHKQLSTDTISKTVYLAISFYIL